VVIGFVLFLTPVDSGTLMIANLCTRRVDDGVEDGHDAPIWLRVFWAVGITVASIGLLLAGNFSAMQTAVVLCGLPFSFTLAFYMLGLLRALRTDPDAPRR
jgi:choline/glycine/proline betaine transport protein